MIGGGAGELQAGRVFVDLVPRLQAGFGAGVEKELDGPLGRIKSKAAGIGKAVSIGVAGGIVGGGALLLGAATKIDDALDTIRTGTGATGKTLESLQGSFRNVAKTVPNDMGEVASAISDLHKRTGLVGPGLEALARKELTLARVTDEDLNGIIRESTRSFGAWGIAAKDQGPKLDYLYKVSQATGIGVTDLMSTMTEAGPTLQQFGIGFDDGAALIGKMEKAGINAGPVLAAMRKGLGSVAKEGEKPADVLARVSSEIEHAGSQAEANQIAVGLFGAKAGPEMARQIRAGNLAVGDLVKSLHGSTETIEKSAADTDDFAEKFAVLKNRIILAAEPLAGKLFDAINVAADAAAPLADWIGARLPGAFDRAEAVIGPFAETVRSVFEVLATGQVPTDGPLSPDSPLVAGALQLRDLVIDVATWVGTNLPPALETARAAVEPVVSAIARFVSQHPEAVVKGLALALGLVVSPLGMLAAGLIYAYTHSERFRSIVDAVVGWLKGTAGPAIGAFAGYIADQFGKLVGWVRTHWGEIQEAIDHVLNVIEFIIGAALAGISKVWDLWGDSILRILRAWGTLLRNTIENALNVVKGVIEFVLAIINGDWGKAWDALKGIVSAVFSQIRDVVDFGIHVALAVLTGALNTFYSAWSFAWGKLKSVAAGIWTGLGDGLKGVFNAILRGIQRGINAAIDLINDALDAIDTAAGPWVNFGTIPHVTLPQLRDGGKIVDAGFTMVGEAGPEILSLPRGAQVIPLDVASLLASVMVNDGGGTQRPAVEFAHGAVQVDARGIYSPELVGTYAADAIGSRVAARIRR